MDHIKKALRLITLGAVICFPVFAAENVVNGADANAPEAQAPAVAYGPDSQSPRQGNNQQGYYDAYDPYTSSYSYYPTPEYHGSGFYGGYPRNIYDDNGELVEPLVGQGHPQGR